MRPPSLDAPKYAAVLGRVKMHFSCDETDEPEQVAAEE
jgi:hypothetical protein